MLVKLDHFPKFRGENKQCLKPPPSLILDVAVWLLCPPEIVIALPPTHLLLCPLLIAYAPELVKRSKMLLGGGLLIDYAYKSYVYTYITNHNSMVFNTIYICILMLSQISVCLKNQRTQRNPSHEFCKGFSRVFETFPLKCP